MKLILESHHFSDYLKETEVIDFSHPVVSAKIKEIEVASSDQEARARLAFEYARDQIRHSFDLQSRVISISASDAVEKKEGICFAKAHVLAALLRGLGIPAGFCYQRVTRKGTPESGFALHGLNALYLETRKRWFRVDPRGNKPGVHSEFSIEEERLAYPIRTELGEVDYPHVFSNPHPLVLSAMRMSADCHELFFKRPERLFLS
jgi:transglutaminase-like putative cysteine protease